MLGNKLLQVKNLAKHFPIKGGVFKRTIGHVKAVDNISFDVFDGETFGLVGESGCGKSTAGRTILRLLQPTSGQVIFEDKDMNKLSSNELRSARRNFQMVFQDPYSSLNPQMTVGDLISEPMHVHNIYNPRDRLSHAKEVMDKVGLNHKYVDRYPHEFSGGQRQRISIARALSSRPKLIIADEPVSALDVSIQSQVINLLQDLQEEFGLTYIFISHDLSVVNHIANRVAVMYLGRIVEITSKQKLYYSPAHPYTHALLSAVPVPDPTLRRERIILPGDVPNPANPPSGCAFHPRCPKAFDRCKIDRPDLLELETGHLVACHLYDIPNLKKEELTA